MATCPRCRSTKVASTPLPGGTGVTHLCGDCNHTWVVDNRRGQVLTEVPTTPPTSPGQGRRTLVE